MATRRRRTAGGFVPRLMDRLAVNPRPIWLVCVCHVLALGIALLLYALPHHVIPHGEEAVGAVSTRGGAVQTAVAAEPETAEAYASDDGAGEAEPASESGEYDAEDGGEYDDESYDDESYGDGSYGDEPLTAAQEEAEAPQEAAETVQSAGPIQEDEAKLMSLFGASAVGSFRKTFGDVFTSGKVKKTDNTYRSENIAVNVEKKYVDEIHAWVYVADIYVADISCLMTAFGQDRYGRGYTEWITNVATRYKGIVTINGDYYGCRSSGVIIRNGQLYRNKRYHGDVCILYWDGHMETMRGSRCDGMTEIDRGAYQSWSFGPSLLDSSGKPLGDFNCSDGVRKNHPRTAIGYFEPGHYCFVTVDGRNEDSDGSSLTNLAAMMSNLGCKIAYNLDGGQTSLMAMGSELINKPSQGGRSSSDYIMIVDRITQ